ncbi:hypothetical protein PG988_012458 [Apiospora saccharicola]
MCNSISTGYAANRDNGSRFVISADQDAVFDLRPDWQSAFLEDRLLRRSAPNINFAHLQYRGILWPTFWLNGLALALALALSRLRLVSPASEPPVAWGRSPGLCMN